MSAASLLSSDTGLPLTMDSLTSASVVPERLRQASPEGGFTASSSRKVLFVAGDPRHESVEWDLVRTAARFFRDAGFETEIRDLYEIAFNPILTRRTFYQAADGFGKTPDDVAAEQRFIGTADYVIFASGTARPTP